MSPPEPAWDVAAGKMLFKVKHGGMSGEDHAVWSLLYAKRMDQLELTGSRRRPLAWA